MKLEFITFFLRAIPEAFLFVFAAYAFTKSTINPRRYVVSSLLTAVLVYIINKLPIHPGINTILGLIVLILLNVNINKIDLKQTIQAGIITMILEFVCEGINVFIVQYFTTADAEKVFNDHLLKIYYGIPSLIVFGLIVGIYYLILLKKKELTYISDGKAIK